MARKGENIHKRKDGRWEGRFQSGTKENGKIKYSSVYATTYKECKEKLIVAKQNKDTSSFQKFKKERCFSEILLMWLDANQIRTKKSTQKKYQYMIERHLIPDIGHKKISEITSSDMNQYLNEKLISGRIDKKGGLSPSYVKTLSIIISSSIKYAIKENFCKPLGNQIFKPCIPKNEMIILDKQAQALLEHNIVADIDETKLGTIISLNTGLRIGELCALRWDDIDLNDRIIHVRHTLARVNVNNKAGKKTEWIIDEPKTFSSKRDIPISKKLFEILKNANQKSSSPFVVSNSTSFVSTRTFEYRYKKMLEQSGIKPINFHALRHTFATRCVESGVDIKSLSEVLGHSNVSITLNTYVHPSMEIKRIQIEKMQIDAA